MTDKTIWETRKEVAARLRVNPRTVDAMVKSGRLTAYRYGARVIRFKAADVDALMTPTTENAG